jgi:hypothetical protein
MPQDIDLSSSIRAFISTEGLYGNFYRLPEFSEPLDAAANRTTCLVDFEKRTHSCIRLSCLPSAMLLDIATRIGRDAPPSTCRIAYPAEWG